MNLVKNKISTLTAAILAVSGAGQISTVLAEDQSTAAALVEIVVTATKRERSLQDVGVAMNAFSSEALEKFGITDGREILRTVPSLIVNEVGGDAFPNIYLRGIGTKSSDINFQTGVGVYIDEIVATPVVANVQTYDLERVEVLKEPQNTLYGRNTTGGAINYISKKPEVGGDMNGYIDATYGRFDQVDIKGAFGAPVGENAAVRVSFISQQRDGFRENLLTGDDDLERDKWAGRIQLAWQPSDDISVLLKAHAEESDNDNFRYTAAGTADANNTLLPCSNPEKLGLCAATGSGYVPPSSTRKFSSDMADAREEIESSGASAHITIQFEGFTLTSITGYEEVEMFASEDTDGTPEPWFHFNGRVDQEQFSQEFRLTSDADKGLRWITGVYGHWEEVEGGFSALFGVGPYGATQDFINTTDTQVDTEIYSVYGEMEYDLSDSLTFKFGLRYSHDHLEGQSIAVLGNADQFPGQEGAIRNAVKQGDPLPDYHSVLLPAGIAGGAFVSRIGGSTDPDAAMNDTNFHEWGGSIGLDWKVTEDVLLYAKWSRGFKAGHFSSGPRVVANREAAEPKNPEEVDTYEIGLKSQFWNDRARVNAAIFFNDYTDQQLAQFDQGVFSLVSADSEIYGAELEATLIPADGWLVTLGMGWLDTETTDAPSEFQVGNELVGAPEFSATYSVSKDWTLDSGAVFGVTVDGRYVGSQKFDIGSPSTGFQEGDDSYDQINALVYYQFGADGQHRLTLWGKNLTDEEFKTTQFGGTVFNDNFDVVAIHYVLTDPETYGVTYRYDF